MTDDDYQRDLEAWRRRRRAALTAPNGWLALVSRTPLAVGEHTVGRAPDNAIVLPVGPDRLGLVAQNADGTVDFTAAVGGDPVRLVPDKANPPRLTVGDLELELTTLNGENALRVRDLRSPAPAAFPPIDHFPARPDLRVVADWIPFEHPSELTVDTSGAVTTAVQATHKAVFELGGRPVALVATHGTPAVPQFVFRDLTSRDDTYPACRFLYGEDIRDGTIVLDFNKAINPPCAFTPFAICPLPPPDNVLPFRIEAGEKRPGPCLP